MQIRRSGAELDTSRPGWQSFGLLGEWWLFIRATGKWWLLPLLVALLILGAAVILSASPYAPFIYSLF